MNWKSFFRFFSRSWRKSTPIRKKPTVVPGQDLPDLEIRLAPSVSHPVATAVHVAQPVAKPIIQIIHTPLAAQTNVVAQNVLQVTKEVNVFEIVQTTGMARRLNNSEVHAGYSGADLGAKLDSKGYFILHAGRLTPTSQDTINKINNPSQASQLVQFAVQKLQADARSLRGNFPDGYYATLAKAIIEKAISYTPGNPDQGVDLAGQTFGYEVGQSSALPVYQIYDAIARLDANNGYDKVQHFVRSAYLQYKFGQSLTNLFQYGKEIRDEIKSWFYGGQGFDSKDMLANNRGQAFGQQLYAKYHPYQNIIRNLL